MNKTVILDQDKKVINYFEGVQVKEYYKLNPNESLLEITEESPTNNIPSIGYIYDDELNCFTPPKPHPTYLLDTKTFEWFANPSLKYDLHNDGNLYQYDKSINGWNICPTD